MQHVGVFPMQEFTGNRVVWRDDQFLQFMLEKGFEPPPPDDLYMQQFSSPAKVNEAAKRFGAKLIDYESLSPDACRKADDWMDKLLEPLFGESRVVGPHEVPLNKKSIPGVVFKMLGCKNKRQAIRRYGPAFQEFWERAWVEDWPILWKQSGKEELLPADKIRKGRVRTFISSDFLFLLMAGCLYYDQNKLMQRLFGRLPFKVGFSKQHGGFNWLAKRLLAKRGFVEEGDVSQWDARMQPWLFEKICAWRKRMLSPSFQTPENLGRIDYHYRQKVDSFLLLPTGQVLLKHMGNPSGDYNTTSDNCLGHMWVFFYHWAKRGFSYENFLSDVELCMYADDYLMTADDDIVYTIEDKVSDYAECGVLLDPTRSFQKPLRCESDLEGCTFLGAKFHKEVVGWVPVPSRNKVLCSILYRPRNEDWETQFSRLKSLMIESYWDRPLYRLIRSYLSLRVEEEGIIPPESPRNALADCYVPGILSERQIREIYLVD